MGDAEEREEYNFSWFPKITRVLKSLPQEYFTEVALAVMEYGNFGTKPEFSNPLLYSVFEGIREDVDNSLNQRYNNKGGRPPKKTAVKTRVSEVKSSSGNSEPGLQVSEGAFEKESSSGNPEPIPYQSIPDHTNPNQTRESEARAPEGFEPPDAEEVRAYFGANGFTADPDEFFDHFEAQDWVRSNGQPVADWKALARSWCRKQHGIDAHRAAEAEADRLRVERFKPPEERAPTEGMPETYDERMRREAREMGVA